jgi:hypothetical protein
LIVFAALGLHESAQGVESTAEKVDGDSGLKGVQEDGKEVRTPELLLAVREEGRPGNGCARTEEEEARGDSAAQATQEDGAEAQDESGEHRADVASRSTVSHLPVGRTGRSVGTALDDGRVQGDEEVQEDRDSDVGHVQTVEDELQQENLNE